jgi:hypothetical protein
MPCSDSAVAGRLRQWRIPNEFDYGADCLSISQRRRTFSQCPRPLVDFIAAGLTGIANHPRFEYAAEGAFYPYESASTLASKAMDVQIPALIALGAGD